MSWRFFVHFSHLPLVQKVLYSGALCVLGLGYLFAMIYVFASHHGRDGKDMLTVDDIVIAYSGTKTGTILESALRGPMSNMLPAAENLKISSWVGNGITEDSYESEMKAIFDKRCVTCHNKRNPHIPQLEDFEGIQQVAEEDRGVDLYTLVRVSHIHLFGLTFIFFIVGSIFCHAYLKREWVKITLIAVPFVAIFLDISAWYITKIYEPFAWVVIISGAAMGSCFALMFFISMYQMWLYRLPADAAQGEECLVVRERGDE
ncbi:hypothetical protein MNBD_GAMMA18-1510 [hydrothermal vent metagenome]|uniref:Elongation factor-1 alpha n=1 Tax=hydrothermal vent metagenome TaxID=652676 RepID=A0A3B0ZEY5_9ZZZZ